MTRNTGYIYVRNWDRFQHYKDRNPPWIKLYTDLLQDDEYLSLRAEDRCLLHHIWLLCAIHGNGRLSAVQTSLMASANIPYGPRSQNLKRLNDAGFIEIRASKDASNPASTRGLSKDKPKRGASAHAENGAQRAPENQDSAGPTITPEDIARVTAIWNGDEAA